MAQSGRARRPYIDEPSAGRPENAYDVDLFEQFAREVDWRLPI
jgi:hypothetical protein